MEYDLSNINTDNIAIGDGSRFEVPLLKVLVSMDELNGTDGDAIDEIFNEADTWLPNQLPDQDGNGYFVSVQRLVEDDQYVNQMLAGLLAQMISDPKTRTGGFAPAGKILRRISRRCSPASPWRSSKNNSSNSTPTTIVAASAPR